MEGDDAAERRGVEAGASDERTVDVGLRHERVDVVGLHAATVQDPHGLGTIVSGEIAEQGPDGDIRAFSYVLAPANALSRSCFWTSKIVPVFRTGKGSRTGG